MNRNYFIIAALLQITWGLTPSASKMVIEEIPVELYITIRWSISGLIFLAFILLKKSWQPITSRDFAVVSVLGVLGYGLASFGTLYGLKYGGVANFAMMSSFGPVISSLFSIWLLKEHPNRLFAIALPLSVAGLFAIIASKYQISEPQIAYTSAALILAAYACESLVFVFSKRYKSKMRISQYLAISQTMTAVMMWLSQLFFYQQTSAVSQLSSHGLTALVFVSVVACVLCFAVSYWLLNFIEGHKLALFDGLHTVSAVVFSYVFFDERLTALMVLGGLAILGGIMISNLKPKPVTPSHLHPAHRLRSRERF